MQPCRQATIRAPEIPARHGGAIYEAIEEFQIGRADQFGHQWRGVPGRRQRTREDRCRRRQLATCLLLCRPTESIKLRHCQV